MRSSQPTNRKFDFGISPRRTYLIARRDFLGYVKTWGFWLTAIGPFIGIIIGILAPMLMMKSEPTRYVTILDETGQYATQIETLLTAENENMMAFALREISAFTVKRDDKQAFEAILETQGSEAAIAFIEKNNPRMAGFLNLPDSKMKFVAAPVATISGLKSYILGENMLDIDGAKIPLSGALHVFEQDGETKAHFWSTKPMKNGLTPLADRFFRNQARDGYLETGGLNYADLRAVRNDAVSVEGFNPEKSTDGEDGQAVTAKDRIPYIVAAGLSMMLWFTVFTGAYMLLVSMVEEKINKVLEMMLASTRFSEIFFGKLIGVAALTIASLLPWILLGAVGFFFAMQFGDGDLAAGLAQAMSTKMLIFLPIFFVLGYVLYGSIFIALGAMAESMQDASTLMTPMVLLLTACMMVVPIGIAYPDSPLLIMAQYIPFSAPFAAIIRLPADPPLWQTLMSVFVLILSCIFVVFFAALVFKQGVLGGGGFGAVKNWTIAKLKALFHVKQS